MSELEAMIQESLASKINPKIAVIGDVMLDEYLRCDIKSFAEGPVYKVISASRVPGGAGNLALGIKNLGGNVRLFSSIGKDLDGEMLCGKLGYADLDYRIVGEQRSTVKKTRVVDRQGRRVLRVDKEVNYPVSSDTTKTLLKELQEYGPSLIVVSDYDKSVVTEELMDGISKMGVSFIVDPKYKNYSVYKDYALIKPNETSFRHMVERSGKVDEDDPISTLITHFKFNNISQALLLTLGDRGADLWVNSCVDGLKQLTGCSVRPRRPGSERTGNDTTGCGDSAMAGLAVGWAWGWELEDCARLAMATAACAVDHVGVHAATLDEVRAELQTFDY